MAIITCPECGKSVSDKAEVCIHCGYPLINPLTKLSPKMEQLWEAEQWQECLNVCNEILLINPKHYVAILRLELCRLFMENDFSIGLPGYEKAVKVFNESTEVLSDDADRFALSIRELFRCTIINYNKLQKVRGSLDELGGQAFRYQMFAPLGSKSSIASNMMYTDAKNKFEQFEADVTTMVETWTRTIYQNFPERLASISKEGKSVYEWIAQNAVIMNPALRQTIEVKHSVLLEQQDWEKRVAEYETKMASVRPGLLGAVILGILPIIFPMMRPDLDASTIGVCFLVTWIIAACFTIPYFYVKFQYKDVVSKEENNQD